jgi:hypothetical protein
MLHLLQLVGGVYFGPTKGSHFNLPYTSQEYKKLVKFRYFRSAWFHNSFVEDISLKKPSKSSHTKSMSKADVLDVGVNLML